MNAIIEKIRAEIERLKKAKVKLGHTNDIERHEESAYGNTCDTVPLFISDREKEEKPFKEPIDGVLYAAACGIKNNGQIEKSEKPIEGLEEEIEYYLDHAELKAKCNGISVAQDYFDDLTKTARHFAQWGAEHRGSSETPKDLEEAAEISFDEAKSLTEDYRDFLAKGLRENQPRPIGPKWFIEYAKKRFITGAKWQEKRNLRFVKQVLSGDFTVFEAGRKYERKQMMKEAVETEVTETCGIASVWIKTKQFKPGQKVKIIIVKED